MTFPVQMTVGQLFNALEGVVYLTDPKGTIMAVGEQGWMRFAADNGARGLTSDSVIGTSIFTALAGDAVVGAYRKLHAAVASGRRAETIFEYRCDSPIAERLMRMSITGITGDAAVVAVLYQSQMLSEVARPAIRMFARDTQSVRKQPAEAEQPVPLCSFCQRLLWPPREGGRSARWIAAAEFVQAGGDADTTLVETICQECADQVVTPNV